jgi:hypothetical protein
MYKILFLIFLLTYCATNKNRELFKQKPKRPIPTKEIEATRIGEGEKDPGSPPAPGRTGGGGTGGAGGTGGGTGAAGGVVSGAGAAGGVVSGAGAAGGGVSGAGAAGGGVSGAGAGAAGGGVSGAGAGGAGGGVSGSGGSGGAGGAGAGAGPCHNTLNLAPAITGDPNFSKKYDLKNNHIKTTATIEIPGKTGGYKWYFQGTIEDGDLVGEKCNLLGTHTKRHEHEGYKLYNNMKNQFSEFRKDYIKYLEEQLEAAYTWSPVIRKQIHDTNALILNTWEFPYNLNRIWHKTGRPDDKLENVPVCVIEMTKAYMEKNTKFKIFKPEKYRCLLDYPQPEED